jgi:hypoxanthine-guanine phosphoribosyltransferase
MLWEILNFDICILKIDTNARFFVELIKLLLPEIIVDILKTSSYKREEDTSSLLKEINSIPKEYRQAN